MAEERVQRRLAAILAADMVGYSRLMEADEVGTIARQKAHRAELVDPEITAHGGRIVKTMGDGILIEFPSVVSATECAVAIQRAMAEREARVSDDRRIQYRVGINLGDIVIDGDDILGDGVNIAARLEGLAKPGGVCISDMVHQSVAGKLDLAFEDLGEPNRCGLISGPLEIIQRWGKHRPTKNPLCQTSLQSPFYRSTICRATRSRSISPMALPRISLPHFQGSVGS
jgi:class 3 adenylate cyclase